MPLKKDAFFNCTQEALDKLTEMYDLVWPIDVSLRYMRNKVTAFASQSTVSLCPDDFVEEFDPQHRTHGVNYQRAFVFSGRNQLEKDENERKLEASQQENLAWLLLSNTIPIFEHWWNSLIDEVGFTGMNESGMEFPTNPLDARKKGIKQQIIELTTIESVALRASFYDLYSSKKNHCDNLDQLNLCMYAYRLFKELRNCYMHSGGVVTNKRIDATTGDPWITVAYNEYQNYVVAASSTTNVLGIEELPVFPTDFSVSLGSKLHITLRGVVGFSNIMRRIMLTVDSELIRSVQTEQYYLGKWSLLHSNHTNQFKLPINLDTIAYFKKVFGGEATSPDEFTRAKHSFDRKLEKTIKKYEYDSMIYLLNSTRILVPHEIKDQMTDPMSAPAQYTLKLINNLLPFLKANNLIDSPVL